MGVKIAAVGDIHFSSQTPAEILSFLESVRQAAEVLVVAGDLTNFGQLEELDPLFALLSEPSTPLVPIVAVFGNHDYESGQAEQLAARLRNAGVHVLDGTTFEMGGVGFAGVKGFLGGYGRWVLAGFGEPEVKSFVQASLDEAAKLERALAGLRTDKTVVVLHYSPVVETLVGESPEIYPYLGTSRLADAIDHHGVDLVLHGHAHHGSASGATPGGVPVHNVALTVIRELGHGRFRVFEV